MQSQGRLEEEARWLVSHDRAHGAGAITHQPTHIGQQKVRDFLPGDKKTERNGGDEKEEKGKGREGKGLKLQEHPGASQEAARGPV